MERVGWMVVGTGLTLGLLGAWSVVGSGDGPRVVATRLAGMQSAGVSGFQIQNLSATQSSTITANAYFVRRGGGAGGRAPRPIRLPNVSAGGAGSAFLPQTHQLHKGIYSALAWADRPIGAIVRSDWFASGGAAIYSGVRLGLEVALPLAMIDYVGASSVVFVQNANPEAVVTIRAELRASGSSDPVAEVTVQVSDLDGSSEGAGCL